MTVFLPGPESPTGSRRRCLLMDTADRERFTAARQAIPLTLNLTTMIRSRGRLVACR